MSLSGKRVLVTGATGFIGGRLVERLILREGAQVTALVRDFAHAARLARFDLRMIPGDVRDLALVRTAAQDCDYVVHCAVSFAGSAAENRDVSVAGAEAVCRAAGEVGAAGLVHLSTFSVYGDTPPGPLVESSPKSPSDAYGKSKLEAEELVRVHQRQGLLTRPHSGPAAALSSRISTVSATRFTSTTSSKPSCSPFRRKLGLRAAT